MTVRVISGLKGRPLIFWAALIACLGAAVLYGDLIGKGLTQTQLYLVLGSFIFPVFYGAVGFALFRLARMFQHRRDYLRIDGDLIMIGRKPFPLANIRDVVVSRNVAGVKQVMLVRNEGATIRWASYLLSRPATEIAAAVKELLPSAR